MQKLSMEIVETLKDKVGDGLVIGKEDLKSLFKDVKKITTDNLALGRVALRCYDILMGNLYKFKTKSEYDDGHKKETGDDKASSFIEEYLNRFEMDNLRKLFMEYHNGDNVCDYYIGIDIVDHVLGKRKDYLDLVRLFFEVFEEELSEDEFS